MKVLSSAPALVDQVREAIVDAIVDGSLRTGERLAQEDLARRLGVSRQPVSHALNVLKEQGVLVELGRKGLTVAPMESGRLRSLYAVRASLDGLAARSAAERVANGRCEDQELVALRAVVEKRLDAAPGAFNVSALIDADVAFHVSLYRLSGNPWLEEITRPQWVHFRRCMRTVLEDRAFRGEVWPEHAGILGAVLAGDVAGAGELAERHARRAGDETAERLSQAAPSTVEER